MLPRQPYQRSRATNPNRTHRVGINPRTAVSRILLLDSTCKPLPVGSPKTLNITFLVQIIPLWYFCAACVFPPRGIAVLASTVLPGCSKSHCISSTSGYHDDADDADDACPGSAGSWPLAVCTALHCNAGTPNCYFWRCSIRATEVVVPVASPRTS